MSIKELLVLAIFIALAVLVLILLLMCFRLISAYFKTKYHKKLKAFVADVISEHLYGDIDEHHFLEIQRQMKQLGVDEKHPKRVELYVDLMIDAGGLFIGESHEKINLLYQKLPPYNFSYNRTKQRKWYNKAEGIREIYEMNQKQHAKHIIKFRNHKNIYVRREAQIGILIFMGWSSLRFLAYLKNTITLWQQIKIVEKLSDYYPEVEIEQLEKAINHPEITNSGIELLIRIIRKFNIEEYISFVIHQMQSEVYDVREVAISCLGSFDLTNEHLDQIKINFAAIPEDFHKILILEILSQYDIGSNKDFFKSQLTARDYMVKLTAAKHLWNSGFTGEVENHFSPILKQNIPA
ncbi:hypothetical protein [Psychroflexus aestuariivivens]|uniref:hypothetical protein n=1 Tax=Psychroflexus aestuariivivens TaxID=1795040 RepID=UPI000FDAEB13|nr:hypothetical protein [Psychroflexus aestuariivivens]